MRSLEDRWSREGAAFPHKEYSNLPHPVQALLESHSRLNYRDNKALLRRTPGADMFLLLAAVTAQGRGPRKSRRMASTSARRAEINGYRSSRWILMTTNKGIMAKSATPSTLCHHPPWP